MKKTISHVLVVLFSAVSIAAQSEGQKAFDEWGEKINSEEMYARLTNLTVELGNRPNSKIAVKIYGGTDEYFSSPYRLGAAITSYLKGDVKISPEKYSIEYCNVNKEALRTEFFILSQVESLPKCEENLEIPAKTTLVENVYFSYPKFKLKPLENTDFDPVGMADGEYSETSLNVLKRLLKESPGSKVYILAYLQTNSEWSVKRQTLVEKPRDKKLLGQRMRQAARTEFIKKGVAASQIVTIDGGYVDNPGRRLELWFVPRGGTIPKPKPDYIPKKAK